MDLYLFNTVINTLWYLFTILFVLYKFTSFFSYVYNFVRFLGKLWSGINWCKNHMVTYINKKSGYYEINNQSIGVLPDSSCKPSWFTRSKQYITNCINSFLGRQHLIPSINERESIILKESFRSKQSDSFEKELDCRLPFDRNNALESIIVTEPQKHFGFESKSFVFNQDLPFQYNKNEPSEENSNLLLDSIYISKMINQTSNETNYIPIISKKPPNFDKLSLGSSSYLHKEPDEFELELTRNPYI